MGCYTLLRKGPKWRDKVRNQGFAGERGLSKEAVSSWEYARNLKPVYYHGCAWDDNGVVPAGNFEGF
jgi:hypothetical protein